jgi:hypothetical protein
MRSLVLAVAVALLAAARADASSFLGSLDPSATPDAWACAQCPDGAAMGFRQFALHGALVDAPEDGVLVSADVYATRLAGTESPRIAVLRPGKDGQVTIADSAPVSVTGTGLVTVDGLHLAVERGDTIGFLFTAGEVDLGVRTRPKPDGAVQWFDTPCDPCGMDGVTGTELLFDATVEPDTDTDGMGDETQDDDGGGLGEEWIDDWFEDWDAGDELDDPQPTYELGLLSIRRGRAMLEVPKAGRVNVSVTLPANRRTGAGPFTTILTGEARARHAGRVRVKLSAVGRRIPRRARTKVVVAYFPRRSALELLMHSARL